jgi:GST-like protein
MICYPWATILQDRNIDLDEFPNVKRWLDEIGSRPAVKKAMAAGPEYREDPTTITAEEQGRRSKLLTHQRAQTVPKEWAWQACLNNAGGVVL